MNAQCHCLANRTFSARSLPRQYFLHHTHSSSCCVSAGRSDPAAAARVPPAAAAAASNAAADVQQVALTEDTMQQYVENITELSHLLGGSQGLKVQQLLDGVINMVYRGVAPTCHVLLGIPVVGQQSATKLQPHLYRCGCGGGVAACQQLVGCMPCSPNHFGECWLAAERTLFAQQAPLSLTHAPQAHVLRLSCAQWKAPQGSRPSSSRHCRMSGRWGNPSRFQG